MTMMSQTAVVERSVRHRAAFATEPMEVGWALEARWFVRLASCAGRWQVRAEISPDGDTWCPLEGGLTLAEPGLHSLASREFGSFLRLAFTPEADHPEPAVHLGVYLALKG